MKKYIFQPSKLLYCSIIILIFSGVIGTVQADDVNARYGNAFMNDGAGAKALAMGGALTSLSDDAWSIFWNPAGLLKNQIKNAGLMHNDRFGGVVDFDAVALSFPQDDGSVLAVGLLRLGVNGIPFTRLEYPDRSIGNDNIVLVDKRVNDGEYALFFSRAFANRYGHWGITPKAIFKNIGSKNYSFGLGFDAGFQARPFEYIPVDVGVSIRDVGGTLLIWNTGHKEIITSTITMGLSGLINISALEARITPTMDIVYRTEFLGDSDAAELRAGLEYLIRDMFALRIGSRDANLTFGGGMNFKPISIDYAYVGHDDLGDTHRVSISIRWASWK